MKIPCEIVHINCLNPCPAHSKQWQRTVIVLAFCRLQTACMGTLCPLITNASLEYSVLGAYWWDSLLSQSAVMLLWENKWTLWTMRIPEKKHKHSLGLRVRSHENPREKTDIAWVLGSQRIFKNPGSLLILKC